MQGEIAKKTQAFQVQIRREKLNKLMGLKRIKPKLIQSDEEAMLVLVDGSVKLSPETNEEQLILAIKTLRTVFEKYTFNNHAKLVRQIVQRIKHIIKNPNTREVVKEPALQMLTPIFFHSDDSIVSIQDLDFSVLKSFNVSMINSTLACINIWLAKDFRVQGVGLSKILKEANILQCLLTIMANFNGKPECFRQIKSEFLFCAFCVCGIFYQTNILKNDQDFYQVLNFSVTTIEKEIVSEAEADPYLRVYFDKKFATVDPSEYYYHVRQITYPFNLLCISTEIINEVNCDVGLALLECLRLQMRGNDIQSQLLRCLIKFFSQTTFTCDDDMINEMLCYVLHWETEKNNEQDNTLFFLLCLVYNAFINSQVLPQEIFANFKDPFDKKYPKTGKLIHLIQYLEDRNQIEAQKKLLEIVEIMITLNGDAKPFGDEIAKLASFNEGKKMLRKLDFEIIEVEEQFFQDQEHPQMDYEENCEGQIQI